jgi:hypothetical protein
MLLNSKYHTSATQHKRRNTHLKLRVVSLFGLLLVGSISDVLAGGGGGCSPYIDTYHYNWSSGNYSLATCDRVYTSTYSSSVEVSAGATVGNLTNVGFIAGSADPSVGPQTRIGLLNYGTINSIVNSTTGNIASLVNYGTIGAGAGTYAIDTHDAVLWKIDNYGTLNGNLYLGAPGATATLNIYGTSARITGDVTTATQTDVYVGDSTHTAIFTTEGNFGAASSTLTSFNVGSGSTLNTHNGLQIYADAFNNSGTIGVGSGQTATITSSGGYTQSGAYLIGINGASYGKLVINGPVTFQSGSSIGINSGSTVKGKTTYSGILTATSITGAPTTGSGTYKQGYATYGYTTAIAGNQVNLTTDAGVATTVDPPRANQANTIIQLSMISNQPVEDRMNWMVGKAYQGTTVDNHAWITPYGSWGKQSDHQSAYTQNILGLAMGADNNITPELFVGGAIMVGNSRLGGIDPATQENFAAKNYQATVYGKYLLDETWHAKAYVTVGTNRSTLNRYDEFAFMPASANVNSMYGGIYTGIEKHFSITPNQKFIPSIIVNYTQANVAGYTDSIGNTVQSQTAQSLITGGSAMYQINFDDYDRLQIKAGAGYDSMTKQSSLQSTTVNGMPVTLVGITPSSFIYNTGISYQRTVERDTYISLGYYYMGSTGYQANILSATYKKMF